MKSIIRIIEPGAAVFRREGRLMIRPALVRELRAFARMWNRNNEAQGNIEQFKRRLADGER